MRWSSLGIPVGCAVLAACALAVGGCGDSKSQDQGNTAPAANAGGSDQQSLKFIFVGNQQKSAPNAVRMVNGAHAADAALGTKTEYRSVQGNTFDPNEERRILENALAQRPDGVLVANAAPDQLNPTIRKIAAAGIPVVLVNAGLDEAEEAGAVAFIGTDEPGMGEMAGRELGKAGAKHALLVTLAPGIPVADQRTKGFQKSFPGKVTTVELPLKDLFDSTKVRNVTKTELSKDKTIDGVFSVGDCCSAPMLAARESLGARANDIHWATFDLGKPVLTALKDGRMDFALDQQPWLQGYLAVQTLAMHIRYAFSPGTSNVATGPAMVDKDNVAKVIELTEKGVR